MYSTPGHYRDVVAPWDGVGSRDTARMNTKALLRHQLETNRDWYLGGAKDMADAAMTFPTPNGGNHPTWLVGHLTLARMGFAR